jgi:hypothetical protein
VLFIDHDEIERIEEGTLCPGEIDAVTQNVFAFVLLVP